MKAMRCRAGVVTAGSKGKGAAAKKNKGTKTPFS